MLSKSSKLSDLNETLDIYDELFDDLPSDDVPEDIFEEVEKRLSITKVVSLLNENPEYVDIAEKAMMALEIAEFATLENTSDVQAYTIKIAENFKVHHEEVDNQIKEFAKGWDFDRLIKVDKDIMRIAITELMFIEEVPHKVVVDEAIELAKKYSTEDSSSFINGVLAKVIYENGIK